MGYHIRRISDDRECTVVVLHDPEDPSSWIVRAYTRSLLCRRRTASVWFFLEEQAERYAQQLVRACRGAR